MNGTEAKKTERPNFGLRLTQFGLPEGFAVAEPGTVDRLVSFKSGTIPILSSKPGSGRAKVRLRAADRGRGSTRSRHRRRCQS